MTATVVSRLHHAATTGRVLNVPTYVTLTVEDAQALDQLIADLCPEHLSCEYCNTPLCEDCGVGDLTAGSECPDVHCAECGPEFCRPCGLDLADDARAEAYAEATGRKY